MNTLLKNLEAGINNNNCMLMGHVVAGFPDAKTSIEAAKGICSGGASFLEVQFPFSDPNADGPVIENACYTSIENGFTVEDGFKIVRELSSSTTTAIIIMTYANIVFKYGVQLFVKKAKECGASALIVPDLPVDYDEGLMHYAIENGMGVILIATPGCDGKRIKDLSDASFGMLYTVARRGTTGNKTDLNAETDEWIQLVKNNSTKPIALGFGIQSKEQTDKLKGVVPIVIAGSYFVTIIAKLKKNENVQSELEKASKALF